MQNQNSTYFLLGSSWCRCITVDAANVLLPIKAGEPKPVEIGQGMSLPQRSVAVQSPRPSTMESLSIFHQPAGTARCGASSLAQALASWRKGQRGVEIHVMLLLPAATATKQL